MINEIFHPNLVVFFPGQLELNLNRMPKPAKSARRCSLQQIPSYEEGRASSSVETDRKSVV